MMQTLYPIIRRVRRSLVVTEAVAESLPDGRATGAQRPTEAAREDSGPTSLEVENGKKSDEEVSTNTDAQ